MSFKDLINSIACLQSNTVNIFRELIPKCAEGQPIIYTYSQQDDQCNMVQQYVTSSGIQGRPVSAPTESQHRDTPTPQPASSGNHPQNPALVARHMRAGWGCYKC